MTVEYFISDHLGSTSITTDASGNKVSVGNGRVYGKPDNGMFQWDDYLADPELDNAEHDRQVIQQFVNNVTYLQDQGAPIPDLNWDAICGLVEK